MNRTPDDSTKPEPLLSFFDEDNPRSLVRLLPEAPATKVRQLARSEHGYLLNLDETSLYRELTRHNKHPKVVDNLLRTKFWMEYDRVQGTGDPLMNMSNIIGRTVSRETYYAWILGDPIRFSWQLCPPVDYEHAMREALQVGVMKLRHALETADFSTEDNRSNRRLDKFLIVFRLLEERLNGFKVIPGRAPISKNVVVRPEERGEVADVEYDSIELKLKAAKERLAAKKAKA